VLKKPGCGVLSPPENRPSVDGTLFPVPRIGSQEGSLHVEWDHGPDREDLVGLNRGDWTYHYQQHNRILTMNPDISDLLRNWPHEPGELHVREFEADDGRRCIQVRVVLGILQMEATGRPDGGESLLEVFTNRLQVPGTSNATLDAEQAAQLREEAALHHHRYVALLKLEDYEGVVADTTHNLAIFDLCRTHAANESDRQVLEQFRAQVLATRARAQAASAVRDGQAKVALAAIEDAIQRIRAQCMGPDGAEPPEITLLQGMRDVLVPKLPSSQRHELEQRLNAALQAENYELAALLRDELRMMH